MKPTKPSPDFPLFPHASGKWAKKIKGKLVYFGRWENPQGALEEYLAFKPKSIITVVPAGLTVELACDTYLTAREADATQGLISDRSFQDYRRSLLRFSNFVGLDRNLENLQPKDFLEYKSDFAKTNNVVTVGNEVTRIKSALKWLHRSKHCSEIDPGPDFRKPTAKAVRRHRREQGKKLFSPAQIQSFLDESGLRMRAMLLLGINCGYHNNDCETITMSTVEESIKSGLLDNVRRKTEVDRLCPLWPVTSDALRMWLARRPPSNVPQAFVLPNGMPFSNVNCDISKRFRAIREMCFVEAGGFSWLRKTFATVAGATGDQVAVNSIMGHVDSSIPGVYRQEVQQDRLFRVVDSVHLWLFGVAAGF